MCKLGRLVHLGVVAAALLLASCIARSLNPLFTPDDRRMDTTLLGTWVEAEAARTWMFTEGPDTTYAVFYTDENGSSGRFRASLGELGGREFLELFPEPAALPTRLYRASLQPVYSFMRLDRDGDALRLAILDTDWLSTALDEERYTIAHEPLEDSILLTAQTPQLQGFMTQIANVDEAFPEARVLQRQ